MIKVIFKNLERSELAKEAVVERLESISEKFPELHKTKINMTLEMQNSPHQAGPDLFTVKAFLQGGKYSGIRLEKSASSLYVALADVVDHILERLNRFGDKERVKKRQSERKFNTILVRT
jgi:ribosome-associated translation inhibitor RaiA